MNQRWIRRACTGLLGLALLASAALAPAVACAQDVVSECPVPDDWVPVLYASTSSPYFDDVFDGVDAFARESSIDALTLVGADWAEGGEDPRLEALVTDGVRAFAIHLDGRTMPDLYERLAAAGADIVTFGTSAYPIATSPVIATDAKAAAMQGTEALIEAMGGSGNIVHVVGRDEGADTVLRREGVEEVVARGPEVSIIQEVPLTGDAEEAVRKVAAAVAANNEVIDGLIATGPGAGAAMAQVLADYAAQGSERDVHAVGFGTDLSVMRSVADGLMTATIVENHYGQGYLSLLTLLCMEAGYVPAEGAYRIDSGAVLVTAENAATFAVDLEALTDQVAHELTVTYLSR